MMGTLFMGLQSGSHLGIYEVLSPLGKGGMGEVYRAHDTRLNRDVALKVLPQGFAQDPFRMARFEREAQLLASLNHPKIAAIYGLEVSGSTRALVMELVEGPTLDERIGRASASARSKAASASAAKASASAAHAAASAGSGTKSAAKSGSGNHAHFASLPLDEALPIAQQVAEALEYAHERGVVHRDLKPANIKVMSDGCVKVLDFGLAKAMGPEEASDDISNSPTLSMAMTQAGFILGTAAYMAPEQAKGKQVDRRADIWAFGCVFYEMLTGKKAFEGETISDVLASVIRAEPDWTALPEATPPSMKQLVRRCLEKDPKHRLRDIGDARIAIEDTLAGAGNDADAGIHTGPVTEGGRGAQLRRFLPWALGAVALVSTVAAAWLLLEPKPPQNVVRFPIPQPENATFTVGSMMSLSPDGRTLAFVAQPGPDKPAMLWLRPLDRLTAQLIPGTENAGGPFWSPDSQQIGFFTNDSLEKVAAAGGAPQVLCATNGISATWNRDGVILFGDQSFRLYRVPDTGGTPALVLAPDPAHKELRYIFPQFLPDGKHYLVEVLGPDASSNFLGAGSLDSKTVERLAQVNSQGVYASPGDLFYLDQNTLMARPFDAKALRFTGAAVPVAQNVGTYRSTYGFFSVSPAGVLAYIAEYTSIENTTGQMTWFNRAGAKQGTLGEPEIWSTPAVSPDGIRLAVAKGEQSKQDIWVFDLKRGAASRLTFNLANDTNPSWLPGGSQILFSSQRKGPYGIYQKNADGLGSTQVVSESGGNAMAIDAVSSDGRYVIYDTAGGSNATELWVLPLFGDRKPFPFVQGKFNATSAQFSPNGRYVAYTSEETGRHEVYVQTFPKPTGKWQISTAGGEEPIWRRDGRELFYLFHGESASGGDKLMSVAVDSNSAAFQAGIPKELFETKLIPLWFWRNVYVPSPDGQRFLMIVPATKAKPQPITVVLNWPALMKK
ncbi:MAG: protein kinase [Terracidiphilus sp.]